MQFDYELGGAPFDHVIVVSGVASAAGFDEGHRRLLADPRYHPVHDALVDLTAADMSQVSAEQVRQIAEMTARRFRGARSLAVVAPEKLAYGLGRMFQSLTDQDLAGRTVVVSSREEAAQWLAAREVSDT